MGSNTLAVACCHCGEHDIDSLSMILSDKMGKELSSLAFKQSYAASLCLILIIPRKHCWEQEEVCDISLIYFGSPSASSDSR